VTCFYESSDILRKIHVGRKIQARDIKAFGRR